MTSLKNNKYSYRIVFTAFMGGILTLGLEIVAGRVLVPFFGSSLHQWAALIGIVLLAYVVGYETYLRINRWGPSLPFAIGGIYVLSLPFWLFPVLGYFLDLPLSIASIGGAFLTTGVPSILWASILPFLQKQKDTKSSSRVLAWSTAGNLAGVWGVAFLGVPEFGTRATLISLGLLSVALASIWIPRASLKARIAVVVLAISLPSFLLHRAQNEHWKDWGAKYIQAEETTTDWVSSDDTAYQQIIIWSGQASKQPKRALMLNGNVQFIWNPNEKLTPGNRYEYYNYATAAAYWTADHPAKSMLALGVAGGIVPWQIRQFLPEIQLTGFELDSTLIRLSQAHLPLQGVKGMDIQIGDGRFLLRQNQKKYDYILLDCFISGFVPFHLTTKEFFELVKSRLNPGGILAINLHTIFAESGLLARIENTMASIFATTAAVDLPSGVTLALASAESISFHDRFLSAADRAPIALKSFSYLALKMLREIQSPPRQEIEVLTDDKNDTEQLLYETRKHIYVKRIL